MILACVVIGGTAAVILASRYHRPLPALTSPAPGISVGSDSVTLEAAAPQWSSIQVAPAAPAAPHWSDPVPGRVVFDETRGARVGSPLAGRVTRVDVEAGQHVRRGDPLFTVASPGLAELRADRARTGVERATAQAELARIQALVDANALPGKELVSAQQRATEAELAARLAEQKLASLRVTMASGTSFTVTAPRDGFVIEKTIAVAQEVDAGSSAVAIADLSNVWVLADVFEASLDGLAPGAPAKIIAGDRELASTVEQISAVVDPDRHTVPVRVTLPNPDGALRPNALVQVRFLEPTRASVEIPLSAVISAGARTYVYVRRAGKLAQHEVTVGAVHGGMIAVLAGLVPGEPVVTEGAILIDNQLQLPR